ncbi:UNVERIFIED_CONTAM: hypothetical protein FKN15_038870 [Acipenser sinensis]
MHSLLLLNISGETHRVRFREYQRLPQRLCDHVVHWLSPTQKTGPQMGEAIVTEQFCHVAGAETQAWIRHHKPDTLEAAMNLVEDFQDSLISAKTSLLTTSPIPWSSRAPTPLPVPPLPVPPPPGPRSRPPRPQTPMGNLTSLP